MSALGMAQAMRSHRLARMFCRVGEAGEGSFGENEPGGPGLFVVIGHGGAW